MTDEQDKPNDKNTPKQPLSARLAAIGGITLGLFASLVIGPQLFPNAPGQGFNVARILCAAAGGGIGALLGWIIGRLIEGEERKD